MSSAAPARPVVVAVGLGPAGEAHTSAAALAARDSGAPLYLRTARHPAAASWLERGAVPLDRHYETAGSFEATYAAIVDELVEAATRASRIVYAVPGSPLVLESTVARLRADGRVEVELVAGMSFLDLAFERLGIDPVASAVRLIDAQDFARQAAGDHGPLLVAHLWSHALCSEVKLAVEEFPDEPVIVLQRLGLPDEAVFPVAWADLDRSFAPDHLTCCYVPALAAPVGAELVGLDELVRTLRERCPWDAEQSHASLARHLIEEAYEAVEAIDELGGPAEDAPAEAVAHLEEELGDVLFQVYFHALLAAEEGLFGLADVARTVHDKLVGRHPHLFGIAKEATPPGTSRAQEASWEQLKAKEKGRESLTEGIPPALPALARAAKLEGRARSAGLGIEAAAADRDAAAAARLAGLVSLLGELAADAPGAEEDLGDLLLDLARLAAARRIEPEQALRRAVGRWEERVRRAERSAGAPLDRLDPPAARRHWRGAGAP
ncbi:MAG: SAM-dependent methyltransferase [Actinomycetota bacterium]|nr:SAM-dependent methyltransferase [Actinomycetota bacterium]